MNDLVIRNLDDGVIESLQLSGRLHGRTLEEEVHAIVTKAAEPPFTAAERLAFANAIRARTPPGPQTDSTELIREDRDR